LAKFDILVYTIESNRHNYEFAKLRLRAKPNVHVELGNSAEVLPALAARLDPAAPTFIYLDAPGKTTSLSRKRYPSSPPTSKPP
jgi:hypothetical protein